MASLVTGPESNWVGALRERVRTMELSAGEHLPQTFSTCGATAIVRLHFIICL